MAKRSLSTYRAKRDFSRTPEPKDQGRAGSHIFVIQRHWATREHYDFRLELDGVLLSWAVARGPSLDPADKRLAVRTEDHPISYAEFEGTIPKGNYGAGTVMLWDKGTWQPADPDPRAALSKGVMKFRLDGRRLQGRWALVRMKSEDKREHWLLIKERDEHATRRKSIDNLKTSIVSGRTRGEIEGSRPAKTASSRASADPSARRATADLPPFVPPMLCELHKTPPSGAGWIHEIKLDGYRLLAAVHNSAVRLYTREGLDWTERFPSIAAALRRLALKKTLLDGEAVIFDQNDLTDFAALVEALKSATHEISYVAFDILFANGTDLRQLPLVRRKQKLASALRDEIDSRVLRLSSFVEAEGARVFEEAEALGAEGIISKKATSFYESRRSSNWIKTKTARREDVLIIGYRPSERREFSSLLAATESRQGLKYAGGVGTGFDRGELDRTFRMLENLRRDSKPPVAGIEKAPRSARWVEPVLRAEVEFQGFTGDGQLRHARFLGWREDRPARRRSAMAKRPRQSSANIRPAPRGKIGPIPGSITNADRIVFPQPGLTKGDVAAYYVAVADRILPHLQGRPISFVRAPEGLAGESFFQRHPLAGMTEGIRRVRDPLGKHEEFVAIDGVEGLVTAAQFGVIELHGWGARLPRLSKPDRVVFDLDPDPSVSFAALRDAAFELRDLLKAVELDSFPLVTGGKGIHLVIPLDATQDWDTISDFAGGIARGLAAADPNRFIATASKEKRKGRIFVDWLRNRLTASAIVPWSLRAKPVASVAMPVTWAALKKLNSADQFHAETASRRKDSWPKFFAVKQRIDKKVIAHLRNEEKSRGAKKGTGKA